MRKTSTARVLIVEDVEFEAKLLMRTLADAGYSNLVHRSDYDSAVAELELGLSVVVDAASMKHFAMHLLGEDDAEGAEALLLEAANILMGTLKTAFTAHAFAFTGGIPASSTFVQTRAAFDKAPVRLRMAMGAERAELELWLRIVEKRNRVVHGRALKEGLVIGDDIFDAKGMLLIRGGSRLTETSAKRIAKLMPDLAISVSDPKG